MSTAKPQTSTHRARETPGAIIVILTLSDYVMRPTKYPYNSFITERNAVLAGQIGDNYSTVNFYFYFCLTPKLSGTHAQRERSDASRCMIAQNAYSGVRTCLSGVPLMTSVRKGSKLPNNRPILDLIGAFQLA